MSDLVKEQHMRELAKVIEQFVEEVYGCKMGFFLCVCPFDSKNSIADYVSNSDREDAVKWMEETAERLKTKQYIPAAKGPVQ